MVEYVAGFMFGNNDDVALIRKNRPAWQAGKLNGIGGHIEEGESPEQAMIREFEEETGFSSSTVYWYRFAILRGEMFRVHFFYTYGDLNKLQTRTDEEVVSVKIEEVKTDNCIPNLTWLIPMAKSLDFDQARYFDVVEA